MQRNLFKLCRAFYLLNNWMYGKKDKSQLYPEQSASNRLFKACLLTAETRQLDIHWSYFDQRWLLAFRAIALVILTCRWAIERYASAFAILQFLTELGFNTTWMYFTLLCVDFLIHRKPHHKICPQLSTWVNLLFETAFCFEFPITLIYWLLLFDFRSQHTSWEVIRDFGVHGFPLVCLAIDFAFNVCVFPLKHIAIVLAYGVLYALINLGYSLTIAAVYDPIDWVSVQSYGWIACCLILVLVVHRGSHFVWLRWKWPRVKELGTRYGSVAESNETKGLV